MAPPHERRHMPDDEPPSDLTAVVTISIRGAYRNPAPRTRDRSALLKRIVEVMIHQGCWPQLDAILLPGGFFRLAQSIGARSTPARIKAIRQSEAGCVISDASLALDAAWPEVTLVVGIDSNVVNRRFGGDQFVTAWQKGEIVGLARKAFPVWCETSGREPVIWVKPSDADDPRRIVTLSNRNRVVLCACYDGFALRALQGARFADLNSIRLMLDRHGRIRPVTRLERQKHLARWTAFLKGAKPTLALIPIHHFASPGRDCYWQRHGIAGASAALHGAPVLGAAHFRNWLPGQFRDCSLASQGVPLEHLWQGHHRQAHRLEPRDGFSIPGTNGQLLVLFRYFTLDHGAKLERNIS